MRTFGLFRQIVMPLPRFERMMHVLGVKERIEALPHRRAVLRRAETRCRGCCSPDQCEGWLERRESAAEAPAYCRNHDMFAHLIDQTAGEKMMA